MKKLFIIALLGLLPATLFSGKTTKAEKKNPVSCPSTSICSRTRSKTKMILKIRIPKDFFTEAMSKKDTSINSELQQINPIE